MKTFELALVTGASSGIGEALCRLLAEKKINLIIHGRNREKLESLKKELPVTVEIVIAELEDSMQRRKIIDIIYEKTPDLIINNAGYGLIGETLKFSTEQQLNILKVNGEALLEISLEGARALLHKKKKGVIMNISSVAGYLFRPFYSVYSASKAFVLNVSQALDVELEPQGVRCLVSCPGYVQTEFLRRATGKPNPIVNIPIMTSEYAANEVWNQIQKGKRVHVFDWKIRIYNFLARFLIPISLYTYLFKRSLKNS